MTETKPCPAKPALVVFDLDGTLIDSLNDIHESLTQCLIGIGRQPIPREIMRTMVGDGAASLIERALAAIPGPPVDPKIPLARFMAHYNKGGTSGTRLYPGCRAMLHRLHEAGHTIALCTNKPIGPTRIILDHFDLTPAFAQILGGDSLPVRKPDPAPLFAIADRLGFTGAETTLVGDSEVDAAAAANAGMGFIFMTYGYHRGGISTYPMRAAFDHLDAVARHFGA